MTRNRDKKDTKVDAEAAKKDATSLIEEMKQGFRDHRLKLDEILAQRTAEQAKLIMDEFKIQNNNKDLVDVIKDDLGGDKENAYLDLITYIREGRVNYFAIRLKEVMDGKGTDDKNLTRLIIYLSAIDLVEVSDAFQKKYGIALVDRVKEETSGFQQKFLLAFMGQS